MRYGALQEVMANRLVINSAEAEDVVFPLIVEEVLVGRLNSVDLIIDEVGVSLVHAKIVREMNLCVVMDLRSKTGTRVNGKQIERHELMDGDVIEIGKTSLKYRE
jgi:pSer/pThr/pTyr-binding forkhead associated (FHA) protein